MIIVKIYTSNTRSDLLNSLLNNVTAVLQKLTGQQVNGRILKSMITNKLMNSLTYNQSENTSK